MLRKIMTIAFLSVSAFAMHSGEININNKDLELSGRLDMGQLIDSVEPDTIFVGAKFLNADKDNSSDNPQSLDPYYEVNFLMMKEIGNRGLLIGMGAKVNYTKNYTTLPLGIELSYKIHASDLIPMYVNTSVYYAPSVLSFSHADDFLEYRISYDIEIIENGRVTLGYRNIDTDYDIVNGTLNYNSSFYLGFKISF
jgi:hypothetical protein